MKRFFVGLSILIAISIFHFSNPSFLGDTRQAAGVAFQNIFANGGAAEELVETIDLSEERLKPLPASPLELPQHKILISEVMYDPPGSDVEKEFIKLFNPNNFDVDLDGWSLKIAVSGGTQSSLAKIGSGEDRTIIEAGGFFIVGFNGYSLEPKADVKRSASLPNKPATVTLYNKIGGVADSY